MKKLKYQILFTILMMTIGIAAVTTNLSLGGSTELAGNTDDFDVYITSIDDISVDSSNNKIVINGKRSFSFVTELQSVNSKMNLDIYLVNASKNYDAGMSYTCDYDDEYIVVNNNLDEIIEAHQEAMATLDVKLNKAYAGEGQLDVTITCEIIATAVERVEVGGDDPIGSPVVSSYNVGDEIAIGAEKFNIISQTDDTVSMLSQLGIDSGYVQVSADPVEFGGIADWGTPTEYMDINIQNYDNSIKQRINGYTNKLKTITNDQTITGDLISLKELEELGCTVSEDYGTTYGSDTCGSSPYAVWLVNGWMWTKTARIGFDNTLWVLGDTGDLSPSGPSDWGMGENYFIYGYHESDQNVVRPVITISKATLAKYK